MAGKRYRGHVRSGVDVGRLSAAVARPGIDPRRWVALARVDDVAIDEEAGAFADVTLLPGGEQETVRVPSMYAGADFGAWGGLRAGATVVCVFPDGDPSAGMGVVSAVLWTGAAPPPPELAAGAVGQAADATPNPLIVVEPGATLRVVVRDGASLRVEASGSGTVDVAATGQAAINVSAEQAITITSPDVRLGETPGSEVARRGDLVVVSTPALVAGGNPVTAVAGPGGITAVGQIVAGAPSVKA